MFGSTAFTVPEDNTMGTGINTIMVSNNSDCFPLTILIRLKFNQYNVILFGKLRP